MLPASLIRRTEAALLRAEAQATGPLDLSRILFPQQLPFGQDASRYQTTVTPRRAGKSYAIVAKLLRVAGEKPGSVCIYITRSRVNAKRIVWRMLKEMNRDQRQGGVVNESELSVTMPNGAIIYLAGANHKEEIENFRGLAIALVILDEAQSLPAYIEELVDEVLVPALTDYAGTLALVGTPGPVPVGYFHDCVTRASWKHHGWSVFDNVHLAAKSGRTTRSLLAEELERRGVTEDDPVIQREWFGRWVLDTNSLVFRFDPAKNVRPSPQHTDFVIGIDLGFDDADAIAVLGWSDKSPAVDLVYEWVGAKQTISDLMVQVQAVYDRFHPLAVVADTGGLGRKIAEELIQRTGIPIEAAEKTRKLEHIELLNDTLRSGRFFAPEGSRFGDDCMRVEWDKSKPEAPKISNRFHSDVCFVAGTMIRTEHGPRPIESLRAGDLVWTRVGLRPVLAHAQTGWNVPTWRAATSSGASIAGTAAHPVWTSKGWRQLRDLTPDCIATEWDNADNGQSPAVALVRVRHVEATGCDADVFNLTVDGEHEYFANGILVSNCDAVLYAHRRCQQWLFVPPAKPRAVLGSPEWYAEREAQAQTEIAEMFEAQMKDNRSRTEEDAEW